MLCYKDRCFCPFYSHCQNGNVCHRALTQQVKDSAGYLKLPIDRYSFKPDCFKEIVNESN